MEGKYFNIIQMRFISDHLQLLYGNNDQPGQFSYGKGAGSWRIPVREMIQHAGSEKKSYHLIYTTM